MAKKQDFDWEAITKTIIEKESKKGGSENNLDGRFFVPKRGADGLVEYEFRFIPPKDMMEIGVPYVSWYNHYVYYNNKIFISLCPKTLGNEKDCDCCSEYLENWSEGDENAISYANKFKRKLNVVSNILMLNDPLNPENNGKVFLYKFGWQILEKILTALKPPKGSTEGPRKIFSLYEGTTFKLVVKIKKGDMPTYEDSRFKDGIQELSDNMINIAETNCYPLGDFIKPEKFDIENEINEKFANFMLKASGKKVEFKPKNIKSEPEIKKEEVKIEEPEPEIKKEEVKIEEPEPETSDLPFNLEDDDDDFWEKVKARKNK